MAKKNKMVWVILILLVVGGYYMMKKEYGGMGVFNTLIECQSYRDRVKVLQCTGECVEITTDIRTMCSNGGIYLGSNKYAVYISGAPGIRTCDKNDVAWTCLYPCTPSIEICNDGIDQDCNGADLIGNTPADTNCNGCVNLSEFIAYADKWVNNQISFENMMLSAEAWVNGTC